MSRDSELMRKSLRKHLYPALARLGFVGKSSTFQRLLPDHLDLLSVQHWKYGGEFVLEFARRERGDMTMSWGDVVPEAKLDVAHTDPMSRARLVSDRTHSRSGFHGFEFAGLGDEPAAYDDLAMSVVNLLPQVCVWLSSGVAGSNIRAFAANGKTSPDRPQPERS